MSDVVVSPAGDTIRVVDDEQRLIWSKSGPVLVALWLDGPFIDEGGGALSSLYESALIYGYDATRPAINHLMHNSLSAYVHRNVSGRRCFEVRLRSLPRRWHERLVESTRHRMPRLPAVIENGDQDGELEPEPVMNDIGALDLMTGMLMAVRRDEKVPIRVLPTLQEWLTQTERVLAELGEP